MAIFGSKIGLTASLAALASLAPDETAKLIDVSL
jgi:hypothetical protein